MLTLPYHRFVSSLCVLAFLAGLALNGMAQTSRRDFIQKGIKYQGFAVADDGVPYSNGAILVRSQIYLPSQEPLYTELLSTDTDSFGAFLVQIGRDDWETFSTLDFGKSRYHLRVEVQLDGSGFIIIRDGPMTSVPYARAAEDGAPVGSIMSFSGSSADIPPGWLLCDGSSYASSNHLYQNLFAVIGYAWGRAGSNFRVPNLGGLFLRGVDQGSGNDPEADSRQSSAMGGNEGDRIGSFQEASLEHHPHGRGPINLGSNGDHAHRQIGEIAGSITSGHREGTILNDNNSNEFAGPITSSSGLHSHQPANNTEMSGGADTHPDNVSMWLLIKF